jgi:Copper transport outer membrane protein, MctB
MLDFRYHALSLVAVFLALGIGIVLGSSLGDTVVSQANRDLAKSLRGDLNGARAEAARAKAGVAQRERFLDAASGRLVGGELGGTSVVLVASGNLPAEVQSGAREAVRRAGGSLRFVAQLATPPDLALLGRTVGPRYDGLRSDDKRLRPLGRRIGRAVVSGGPLARRLEKRFPDRFSGGPVQAESVVFFRDPATDRSDAVKQFEQGLIQGLRSVRRNIVAVETLDTDPSQIGFYSNQRLTSVDNIDSVGGRIALGLALAQRSGGAGSSYGYKKTADTPLPEIPGAGGKQSSTGG